MVRQLFDPSVHAFTVVLVIHISGMTPLTFGNTDIFQKMRVTNGSLARLKTSVRITQ